MVTGQRLWTRVAAQDPMTKDAGLAIALELLAIAELAIPIQIFGGSPLPPAAWPVLSLAVVAPVAWRRKAPLTAFAVQAVAYVVSVYLSGHLSFSLFVFCALFVGAYSSGAYAEKRRWSLALVIAAGLASGLSLGMSRFLGGIPGIDAGILLIPWLIGNTVRSQRRLVASLQDRAARLESERDAIARASVAEERAHIARELHDVVAHAVSIMVVQAEAARKLLRKRPEDAEEALRMVSTTGSEALNELKHLLGLLGDGERPNLEPAPGLRDLDAMLTRLHSAGLRVDLRVDGDMQPLPRGIDLTAYRVVQEALTNVLKHASGSGAQVWLRYGDQRLEIEVDDLGQPAANSSSDGRGLIGMRQRVEAYGGDLEAGPRRDGGYSVRVRLPLETNS